MLQQTMTEQELFLAARNNYQHLVKICERLELDGYWEQPQKILKQPVVTTLNIYVQSVLLLYAMYANCLTPQIRLWLQKITGEDVIRIRDIDRNEAIVKQARKITYSPPILLQLCGVADRNSGTENACVFLDSMLNMILVIACQAKSPVRDVTRFLQEYYQHVQVFLNRDTAEQKMNARYLFRKLSCERIEESLSLYIEDKQRKERQKKIKEDLERLELSGNRRRKTYLATGEEEETDGEKDLFEVPVFADGVVWEQPEPETEKSVSKSGRQESVNENMVNAKSVLELELLEEQEACPEPKVSGYIIFEKNMDHLDTLNINGLCENPPAKLRAGILKLVGKKTGHGSLQEKPKTDSDGIETGKQTAEQMETAKEGSTEEMQGAPIEEQIPDAEVMKKGFHSLKKRMENARTRELDALLEKLHSLIGLCAVKEEIDSLINLIKVRKMRQQYDMPVMDMTYHMVFTGSPGTGKTTVARLVAKIYKELGILSKGGLVETDRSGLVAGYIGQTAIKVKEVVESALGGVLFIDEAYSLTNGNRTEDFGSEVIDTLVKLMEDHRDDLVVIVAGYTKEMKEFLKSNSGLVSRFNKFIEFPDYTDTELLDILDNMAEKAGFQMEPAAREQIGGQLFCMTEQKRRDFGNARGIRNVFEKIVVNQANRLVGAAAPTKEDLALLKEDDTAHVIL